MVEKDNHNSDPFIKFRTDPIVKSYPSLDEVINIYKFEEKIQEDIAPHLHEWFVINYKLQKKELNHYQYMAVAKDYVKSHRVFFENPQFLKSLSKITNYLGLAA